MRPQLADEVATALRERIMSGDLRPGARIRLEEVAAQLGVSITPVREALLTLRGEDMVELQPRRGYVRWGVAVTLTRLDGVTYVRLKLVIRAIAGGPRTPA